MNAIGDVAEISHRDIGSLEHQTATYTLRRTGRKPVRFVGWQLIEATGADTAKSVWHELNVYRTIGDKFVVELTVRRRQAEELDKTCVSSFPDLAAAAAWLENYRPADDVPVPSDLPGQAPLPWAVLQAVQLRQCINRVVLDYQTLLSEVFAALDLSDPPDEIVAPG
ncbi:MAG TPA: hypothetical protein VHO91_18650 [Rhodopila sp.]|nr:hypothetical protein [Rhodopila sp.]